MINTAQRPAQETEGDRRAEEEITDVLCRRWGAVPWKLCARAYGLDSVLVKGDAHGDYPVMHRPPWCVIEVKNRPTLTFGMLPDGYYVALSKALRAKAISDYTGLTCLMVVRFAEGDIRWTKFGEERRDLIMHGRTDRHFMLDVEPCVAFDWDSWRGPAWGEP